MAPVAAPQGAQATTAVRCGPPSSTNPAAANAPGRHAGAHLDDRNLVGLAALALNLLGDDLGRANLKLVALAPHVLDQDAQVQRAAPRHAERLGALTRLHAQRQVALQLAEGVQEGCGWVRRWGACSAQPRGGIGCSCERRSSRQVHSPRGAHRSRRSLRLRLVTNLPSLPAKGEVLTLKVMDTVGSSTLMVGSATGLSLVQMVSPI